MAACMSDRKARSIDSFFIIMIFVIIQSHIPMNNAPSSGLAPPINTNTLVTQDSLTLQYIRFLPDRSYSSQRKQNKDEKQICIHDCEWSQGLCPETYFNGQLDFFGKLGEEWRLKMEDLQPGRDSSKKIKIKRETEQQIPVPVGRGTWLWFWQAARNSYKAAPEQTWTQGHKAPQEKCLFSCPSGCWTTSKTCLEQMF